MHYQEKKHFSPNRWRKNRTTLPKKNNMIKEKQSKQIEKLLSINKKRRFFWKGSPTVFERLVWGYSWKHKKTERRSFNRHAFCMITKKKKKKNFNRRGFRKCFYLQSWIMIMGNGLHSSREWERMVYLGISELKKWYTILFDQKGTTFHLFCMVCETLEYESKKDKKRQIKK